MPPVGHTSMGVETENLATTAQNRAKASSVEGKALSTKDLWPAQVSSMAIPDQPAWQIARAVLSQAMSQDPTRWPSGRRKLLRFSPHFPFALWEGRNMRRQSD